MQIFFYRNYFASNFKHVLNFYVVSLRMEMKNQLVYQIYPNQLSHYIFITKGANYIFLKTNNNDMNVWVNKLGHYEK